MKKIIKNVGMGVRLFFIFLIIYIFYYFFETRTYVDDYIQNLEKDGFCILCNPEYCISNKMPSEKFIPVKI